MMPNAYWVNHKIEESDLFIYSLFYISGDTIANSPNKLYINYASCKHVVLTDHTMATGVTTANLACVAADSGMFACEVPGITS